MSEGFSHEAFLGTVEPDLARLARGPGNAGALAGARAAFAAAETQAGVGAVAELARSAANLLSALLEGHVAPTPEAADLVAQAARGLVALDAASRADLAERLDAAASGLSATALEPLPPRPAGNPEPPLLTEREDGVVVVPGMFADPVLPTDEPSPALPARPEPHPLPVASSTVPPQPLAEHGPELGGDEGADEAAGPAGKPALEDRGVARAPEARAIIDSAAAALAGLERQLVALATIASGDDPLSTAVQHTAGEIAATAAELQRLNDALAQWVDGGGDDAASAPADAAAGGDDAAAPGDEAWADEPPTNDEPPTRAPSEASAAPTTSPETSPGAVQAHSLDEVEWIKLQGGRE